MLNSLIRSWNTYVSKRMLIALGLSVLIHLYTIGGFDISLPNLDISEDVVEVRLAPPVVKPLPQPSPPAPQAKPQAPTKPASPKPAQQKPEVLPEAVVNNPPEPVAKAEPVLTPPVEEKPTEMESVPYQPLEDIGAKKFKPATYVNTTFVASSGGIKGESQITYKVNPDGTYSLRSEAEVKGFAGLFFGKLLQTSDGTVGEAGLRPKNYFYQYGMGDSKSRKAAFDWASAKLTMENAGKVKVVDLPEGTQDLLSFMYQFMFVPPLENMQLLVTDGKKLRHYDYRFEGEEDLTTDIGVLKTLHIGKSSGDGEEKTEVWLGVEYNYLPVKIRKTEKDGKVIEQLVTRISSDMFK